VPFRVAITEKTSGFFAHGHSLPAHTTSRYEPAAQLVRVGPLRTNPRPIGPVELPLSPVFLRSGTAARCEVPLGR